MRGLKSREQRGGGGGGGGGWGSDGSHPGFIEAGVGRVRPEDRAEMGAPAEIIEVEARMVEGASYSNRQGETGEGGDAVEMGAEGAGVDKRGVIGGDEAGMGKEEGAIGSGGESGGEGVGCREEGGSEGGVVAKEGRRGEGGAEAGEDREAVEGGLADQ